MAAREQGGKQDAAGSVAVIAPEIREEAETEIDLIELFYRLLENAKYIVLAAILGALLMGVYSFVFATPKYESTAKLYVLTSNDSVVNLSDLQIGTYLTSDYQEVFKTWEVHERVLQNLNLDYTYEQMQSKLSISNPSNTRILYITASSSSPAEATMIANEYAEVARQYISETMSTEIPNLLSVALEPITPVSPQKTRNVLLGLVLGAVVAAGIIVVLFIMDDKIKTSDDIMKYTGIPTLAVVPLMDEENLRKIQKANSKAQRRNGEGKA